MVQDRSSKPTSSSVNPGTMASSQGSTSTKLPSLQARPSISSSQSSNWTGAGTKRERSSPEASSSRHFYDRRSSIAAEDNDELEEGLESKKPVKRMSTGSAAGLTSESDLIALW
jgi:hypothetical protein